jgi:hypothetical protein
MSGSPQFKIYNKAGGYVASCKHLEDCACLMALYGDGATVRLGHSTIIWREGEEEIPAAESYDRAAQIMQWHIADRHAQAEAILKMHQQRPVHPGVAAAMKPCPPKK